jgi:hypothetical protein
MLELNVDIFYFTARFECVSLYLKEKKLYFMYGLALLLSRIGECFAPLLLAGH